MIQNDVLITSFYILINISKKINSYFILFCTLKTSYRFPMYLLKNGHLDSALLRLDDLLRKSQAGCQTCSTSKLASQLFHPPSHFLRFWSSPRPISNSQLHMLPCFHPCPIYLVLFKGSYSLWGGISHLEGGFTLRCLQRLSLPDLATLPCN